MTLNTYPPGPYTYDRSRDGCDDVFFIHTERYDVAQVRFWGDPDAPEHEQRAEATARLIAAAPELLEALTYFFNIMHDYPSSREKGYVDQAMEQARTAIGKAKEAV